MSTMDVLGKGCAPGAAYDLLQASSASAVGWRQGAATHEAVTTPTLGLLWVASSSPHQAPGYYKDPLGRVHLRGSLGGGVAGTTLFTLPVGYRPAATRSYAVPTVNALGGYALGVVTIDSGGLVTLASGSTTRVSLDGVNFDLG